MWQQRAGKPVAEATMERGSSDPQLPVLPTLFVVFPVSVFTFHLVITNQPSLSDYLWSQLAKVTGSLALARPGGLSPEVSPWDTRLCRFC